jgi:Ase1/PRC1/MAP65 family protein
MLITFCCHMAALVDTLAAKTRVWEAEKAKPFTYDGVPLLAMLEEYTLLRHNREEDKRRLRVSINSILF